MKIGEKIMKIGEKIMKNGKVKGTETRCKIAPVHVKNGKVKGTETRCKIAPVHVENGKVKGTETRCKIAPVHVENGCMAFYEGTKRDNGSMAVEDDSKTEKIGINHFVEAFKNFKEAEGRLKGYSKPDFYSTSDKNLDEFLVGDLSLKDLLKDYPIFSEISYNKLLDMATYKTLVLVDEMSCIGGLQSGDQISEELQEEIMDLLNKVKTTIETERKERMNNLIESTLVYDVMAKM